MIVWLRSQNNSVLRFASKRTEDSARLKATILSQTKWVFTNTTFGAIVCDTWEHRTRQHFEWDLILSSDCLKEWNASLCQCLVHLSLKALAFCRTLSTHIYCRGLCLYLSSLWPLSGHSSAPSLSHSLSLFCLLTSLFLSHCNTYALSPSPSKLSYVTLPVLTQASLPDLSLAFFSVSNTYWKRY